MKRWLVLAALIAAPASAHEGHEHEAIGWTLTPSVTVPLLFALLCYAVGFVRLWRRAERGRPALRRDAAVFALGWFGLAGALVTPLHEAGERSFAMHMIEHEIIMLVAALFLVLARPGPVFLWAFPTPVRGALASAGRWPLWRMLTDPFVATTLQALAIIVWHVPWLFDLTLRSDGWHIAQHLSFIASALLFWWAMVHGRTRPLVSAACLFVTSMIGGGLGALMALSNSPWFPTYAALGLTPAGFTPEQDQQLAGLIMWVPGGAWHLAAALYFLQRALRQGEERHALR